MTTYLPTGANACATQQVEIFLEICGKINLPVADDKTFWASEVMTFLGFLLDMTNQIIGIPQDKLAKGLNMVRSLLKLITKPKKHRKVMVLQLQQLCGFLNFLGHAVVPGRTFTRRLYAKLGPNLKPHHHIRVDDEMLIDLQIWEQFLMHPSAFFWPFSDFNTEPVQQLIFYSDASRNFSLGFGAFFDKSWMQAWWTKVQITEELNLSIQYLELYAVTAAVITWLHRFQNKKVVIFCDNEAVVNILNNTMSSCKNCMVLVRFVVLQILLYNVKLFVKYVNMKWNEISDSLSHFQNDRFRRLTEGLHFEKFPTPVPKELYPVPEIWIP